jgi:hypothetical protein
MTDPIRSVALAVAVLLIAWGVFGFISIWWQKRKRRRQCGAVYRRASEPLIRGQLVVSDGKGGVRAARPRNNPTADGGTDEGP